jgi:hypothetical protein
MFIYVFFTWVIANMLHPIVLGLYYGEINDFNWSSLPGIYLIFFIYVLLFSIPSLALGVVFMKLLRFIKIHNELKLFILVIMAPLIVVINLAVISFLFEGSINFNDFEFCVPAMIASIIAILIRYKSLFKILAIEGVDKETSNIE